MIGFFPTPYEDELLYSWLARYYVRAGYLGYVYVAEDLFRNVVNSPSVELISVMTDDALKALTAFKSMEGIILDHTMFPCYGRFTDVKRRRSAFDALLRMDGNADLLPRHANRKIKTIRSLKYCPLCVAKDRDQAGEAYWHRVHQLPGISSCPYHGCNLISSSVMISGKASPNLVAAEVETPIAQGITQSCTIDYQVAQYMSEVFQAQLNIDADARTTGYLNSKLFGTPYVSVRGGARHLTMLRNDFVEYYQDLSASHVTERSQIEKVLSGNRVNFDDVCLIAKFLEIPAQELANPPQYKSSTEITRHYDKAILLLHNRGFSYTQVAKYVGGSYGYVKRIGEGNRCRYAKGSPRGKGGPKQINTPELDKSLHAEVERVVADLYYAAGRPQKITINKVAKILGFHAKKFDGLPMCRTEIEKYAETYEQFWAREVEWAIKKIQEDGRILNYTAIRRLVNIGRDQFDRAVVLIGNNEIADMAKKLL